MNIADENIEIVFNYLGKKIILKENKDTSFSDLSKRFCSQAGIQDKVPTYYLGSLKIESDDNQTLSKLNIYNNSEINVLLPSEDQNETLNIIFSIEGISCHMKATKDTKFCVLSKQLFDKGLIHDMWNPSFIVNSCLIKPNEERSLAELNICDLSRIMVINFDGLIG